MDAMNVNWKAIAEEWIKNKQQQENSFLPQAPDPPQISHMKHNSQQHQHMHHHHQNHPELGEADMELEDNETPQTNNFQSFDNSNWKNFNTAPNWNNNSANSNPSWFTSPPIIQPPPPDISQNFIRPSLNTYHISNQSNSPIIQTQHQQQIDMVIAEDSDPETSTTETMDAHKRKLLPAWIREGLEKMEKEKQTKQEKERELEEIEKEAELSKIKYEEVLREIEREKLRNKEQFVSEEEEEKEEIKVKLEIIKKPALTYLQREEIYENTMLLVRKNLTEILLEVTNDLIYDISKETVSKLKKGSFLKIFPVGLGLTAYSGSSASEDESNDEKSDTVSDDTEVILKEKIRQKKLNFEKVAKEIEAKIDKEDYNEQLKREKYRNESVTQSTVHDDNTDEKLNAKIISRNREDKYDTIYSISGARMREKRGSRFSDVRDARNPGCLTHVTMFKNVGLPSDIGLMKVPETNTESTTPSGSLEKKRKKSSSSSSDDDASSNSEHRRKHKKHKKGKSKRSSRRDEREYERYKRDRRSRKSERSSIESKSSIRSDRSETKRRSRSRDRHRRY
ncbi:unnamed protein product [Diamesa tonsa]